MSEQIAPYFGYLASLALIIALLVSTEIKFRIFSLAGNVFFIIYGIIFHAWPVIITNAILLVINLRFLYRILKHRENFDLISFVGDEKLVLKFLDFYKNDIAEYFPGFTAEQLKGNLNFVVLRDLVIANIFSADVSPDGNAVVQLNYTVKKYRDYKIGRYIFEREKQFLLSKGVQQVLYPNVSNKGHEKFLLVHGFQKKGNSFFKVLNAE